MLWEIRLVLSIVMPSDGIKIQKVQALEFQGKYGKYQVRERKVTGMGMEETIKEIHEKLNFILED